MVRIIGYLVGLAFAVVLVISLFVGVSNYFKNPPEELASDVYHQAPKDVHFASDGPFGHFDKRQLQRGFQVYSEVCSACHSLNLVAFRDLKQLGYDDAEIKAIAANWKTPVADVNPDTGEASTRKATPADHFPPPFANEVAARAANNNAVPPDLSDMTKARAGGPQYVYSILTGFQPQPASLLKRFPQAKTPANLHYNPYFASLNIAMPPPLTTDGQVQYQDGTKATVDQMATDVAAFLVWTAEPNLERRHAAGIAVAVFLALATVFAFLAYHDLWDEAKRSVRLTGPLDPENKARSQRASRKAGISG